MKDNKSFFPNSLLSPISAFLRRELFKLKRQSREAKKNDPFQDASRLVNNDIDSDVDEQLGHQNVEMRIRLWNKQIVQVRKALTRLKLGKYGLCEKCGSMIDTDRLSVYPETTLCLSCQKKSE